MSFASKVKCVLMSSFMIFMSACGPQQEESPSDTNQVPARGDHKIPSKWLGFCLPGYKMDSYRLCVNESSKTAVGPFTAFMMEGCKNQAKAYGMPPEHCSTKRYWPIALARKLRAPRGLDFLSDCMPGASKQKNGLCRGVENDNANAFGPFPRSLITLCVEENTGEACFGMRMSWKLTSNFWDRILNESKPKPAGKTTWDIAQQVVSPWTKLSMAIGYAEGTLEINGEKTSLYYYHNDSNLRNVGVWSCTLACVGMSPEQADKHYLKTYIQPSLPDFIAAVKNAGMDPNLPLLGVGFFLQVTQSPWASQNFLRKLGQMGKVANFQNVKNVMINSFFESDGSLSAFKGDESWLRHDQNRRLSAAIDFLQYQGFTF